MDKNQVRNICILLIVLIACAAAFFLLGRNQEEEETDDNEEVKALTEVSADNIVEIGYIYEGNNVVLTKKEDVWYYGSVSLNKADVRSMASGIESLSSVRIISGADVDLESFGLDNPQNVISYKDKDGTSHTVSIGIQNSITNDYYAAVDDGRETVYTISSSFPYSFNKDPESLASEQQTE